MRPGARLGESAQKLVRMAARAASRAKGEAARLAPSAKRAAPLLEAARLEEKSARIHAERHGWLPVLGPLLRSRHLARQAAVRQAGDSLERMRRRAEELGRAERRAESVRMRADGIATFAATAPVPHEETQRRVSVFASRTLFLERDALAGHPDHGLLERADALLGEALAIVKEWGTAPPVPAPVVTAPGGRTGPATKGQMILDLDGSGRTDEEPRIWLPVSRARTREMVERGAHLERGGKRGSQLWIPVSEREKLNDFLPLAFRAQPVRLHYPPIRSNAVGANLHEVFDRASWNHIRSAAYDRAGHRCQICGKQGGSFWNRIATEKEKARGGVVDCHEVWEWTPSETDARTGVQRLSRLLVLCKDCHMSFHDSYAVWRAGERGLDDQARAYLHSLRCLANRCDSAEMHARIAEDRAEYEATRDIGRWVLDLSHLASQDYMSDHVLTLKSDNKAGVGPERVGGIAFTTEGGTSFACVPARDLADGGAARPISGTSGVSPRVIR